jgi:hypothetical protein
MRIGFAGLILALSLAGCAGRPLGAEKSAAEFTMTGRWILGAPNAPSCGLNFNVVPGAQQGTIAPEGGCPGDFFTSRRWTLAEGTLTIADEESQPLAQLKFAGDRFAGQSTGGIPITLTR